MVVLDKLSTSMKEKCLHVLIFSQMSHILRLLSVRAAQYVVHWDRSIIDSHSDLISAINEYNESGSEKFILLLTTRAESLGINLMTVDITVLYNRDWYVMRQVDAFVWH
jgi:SWI/SNF-related matrix-associated actin-dependent regulator of chromatin subfamily A member 5